MAKRRPWITCLMLALGVGALCGALVLGLTVYYATRPRERYDQQAADLTVDQAGKRMQEWLDLHLPGATLYTLEHHYYQLSNGLKYITGYLDGTYRLDGQTGSFVMDFTTDEVYLPQAENGLQSATPAYVCEVLGLPEQTEFVTADATLVLPCHDVSVGDNPHVSYLTFPGYLPADAGDAVAWLRSGERPDVLINVYAHPGDDVSLASLSFDHVAQVSEQNGITFDSLYLTTRSETLDVLRDHYYYEHFTWGQAGPLRAWYRDTMLEQNLKDGAFETVWDEQHVIEQELKVAEQANGYDVAFAGTAFPFYVYADAESELAGASWQWTSGDEQVDLTWKNTLSDGVCLSYDDVPYQFHTPGSLTWR